MSKMHLVSTHTLPQMRSREQFANQKSTLQTLQSSEYLLNHARFSSLSRFILKVALFGGKDRENKDNFIIGFAKTSEFNSDAQAPALLSWLAVCRSLNHSASFAESIEIVNTCELI